MKTLNLLQHHYALLLLFSSLPQLAQCYIIDGSSPPPSILSRFHNTQCKLLMTIDQTIPPLVDDNNPQSAAAAVYDYENFVSEPTSSKFGIPLDIQFTSDTCTDATMNNEPLLLGNNNNNNNAAALYTLQPLKQPNYITHTGQKTLTITPGAYACQPSHPQLSQYFFRFFLDFPQEATRNDVTVPAERLYFMSSCWNSSSGSSNKETDDSSSTKGKDVIALAREWRDTIRSSLNGVNRQIEQLVQERNLIERTKHIPQYLELVSERKKLMVQIDMLEDQYPIERELVEGPTGGETMMLKEGVVAVKRVVGGKVRYHWIGNFCIREFLEVDVDDSTSEGVGESM